MSNDIKGFNEVEKYFKKPLTFTSILILDKEGNFVDYEMNTSLDRIRKYLEKYSIKTVRFLKNYSSNINGKIFLGDGENYQSYLFLVI